MAGQITVDSIKASSGVLATQNGMTGIAKAWVNYNSTARTITNSFNVSSVTYNSAGDFTINFTTAMPNANYAACGMTGINAWMQYQWNGSGGTAPTTTSLRVGTEAYNTSYYDTAVNSVIVFGN